MLESSMIIISFQCNKGSLVQAEIEIDYGLPDIRLTGKCLEALKQAGFEVTARYELLFFFPNLFCFWHKFQLIYICCTKVIWEKDLAVDSPLPWYLPFDKSHFSLSSFRLTAAGRFITKNMVRFVSLKFYKI